MWEHVPTAQELLGARLAHGWRPTPTELKSGDRVLGYAQCAVTGTGHRPSGAVSPAKRPNAELA